MARSPKTGVLGLYRAGPGSLSPEGLADALVCADVALVLLLSARAGSDGDGDGWARDGWSDDHAAVYQVTGMVSVQRGVGLEEALAVLRAYAFAQDRPLGEVVARRLRLDADDAGDQV